MLRGNSSLNGSLHELRREERERDRHIDLADAAFFPRSDLIHTGDGAGNDFFKPAPTARDGCDKCGAGLGADRATVLWRLGGRHDDLASPFHWRLLPWHAQNKSIMIHGVGRIAGRLCLRRFPDGRRIGPQLAGFAALGLVSAETNSVQEGILGGLSLALGIPFPGNGDRRQQRRGSNVATVQSNPASDADATIRRGGRRVGPRPFRAGVAHRSPP